MDDMRLRALLTAANCGSLSKAAEQLDYTQSGITHMMNKLEEELGCPLLTRTNRGILLSVQGERLRPYIENVLAACDELQARADEESAKIARTLKLGCFPSISHGLLPKVLKGFSKAHPEVQVEVMVGGMEMEGRLQNGEVHVMLMTNIGAKQFEWLPLRKLSLVAVVPPDFDWPKDEPIGLDDLLKDLPLLSCEEQYIERSLPKGVKRMQVESQDDLSMVSLVASGLGVAVLSELSLEGYVGEAKVLPLKENFSFEVGAAVKSYKVAEPAAKDFLNYLKRGHI